jgi:hypothetical protein
VVRSSIAAEQRQVSSSTWASDRADFPNARVYRYGRRSHDLNVVLTNVEFRGNVSGSALTFAGDMGERAIDGTQMIGTCTSEAGTCNWDADLR